MGDPYYTTWTAQNNLTPFKMLGAQNDRVEIQLGKLSQSVWDLTSISFQASFGHNPRPIHAAVTKQLKQFSMASPKAQFDLKLRASEKLLERINLGGGKLFYTLSGAESVENALKMAREVTGRLVIMARGDSYHGASLGALSVTGDWRNQSHATVDDWTLRVPSPLDDPDGSELVKLAKSHGVASLAGLIVETVSGVNGVVSPRPEWWRNVTKFCKSNGIMLILDEVLSGFYRTGKAFGFQHNKLEPDFICFSKAITGGVIPFGAVWTSDQVASFYEKQVLSCGLTNYAHPLGLAAMEAVLDWSAEESFELGLQQLEQAFSAALNELQNSGLFKQIRQVGFLAALESKQALPTFAKFLAGGFYLVVKGDWIILAPPLTMLPQSCTQALNELAAFLKKELS